MIKETKRIMDFMENYNRDNSDKIRQWHTTEKSLVTKLQSGERKVFKLEYILSEDSIQKEQRIFSFINFRDNDVEPGVSQNYIENRVKQLNLNNNEWRAELCI